MPQLTDEAARLEPQAPEQGQSRPPNLVLITIDALRADRTTPYGYTRNTTPHLAEFAETAVVFDNAYTSGGWTCLALPSLFSGVYPRRLQWKSAAVTSERRVVDFPWQGQLKEGETFLISVTVPKTEPNWWLPDALKARGYQTIAVLSRSIRQLSQRLVDHGWDRVHVPEEATDIAVSRLAIEQMPTLGEQPFFMWLHYYDVHYPQTEHSEVPNFGPSLEDKYDHEVASTDFALSKLFGALEALPNTETAIVVTADHGEAFESGRQFHGADLFEDGIRIPLLLRAKGLAAGRVSTPVSLVDIAPTLLALGQLKAPRGLDGADLRLARGDRSVVTDLFRVDDAGQPLLDMVAVTNSSQRLARDNLKQVESLVRTHDLQRPPLELELLSAAPELTEALSRYAESAMGL